MVHSFVVMLNVILLSVIIMNIVMLSAVVPHSQQQFDQIYNFKLFLDFLKQKIYFLYFGHTDFVELGLGPIL